jgi:uncharacterized protein with HEPN domain
MPRDLRAWLSDVVDACRLIEEFATGKNFDEYAASILLRSAVERQLEIVGEALRVAAQQQPDLAGRISNLPAIVAFRNQLTHAYSAIDHRTVWGIVERRVPELRAEVELILARMGPQNTTDQESVEES